VLITCAACSTQFQLDDARVPVEGIRVRCSICKHAFFVPHPDAIDAWVEDPLERAVAEARASDAAAAADVAHDLGEGASEAGAAAEESWEFDDGGRLAAQGQGPGAASGFEQSFAAARSAVDDLLGIPLPAAAPARPGATVPPAAAAAETWSAPDEPGGPESFGEPAEPRAAKAAEAALAAGERLPGSWDETLAWGAAAPAVDGPEEVDGVEAPPLATRAAALASEAAPDAVPGGIYEEIPGLASPEQPAEPVGDDLEPLDLEPDEAGSDADLDLDLDLDFDAREPAGSDAPPCEVGSGVVPGAGTDAADEALAAASAASGPGEAVRTRASAAARTDQGPVGLGAMRELGTRRGAPAALRRAGDAAGWAVVALLVGAALWGALAPGRGVQAAPAAQAVAGLEAGGIAGRWVESALAGPVYVVSGELHNPGPGARAPGVRLVVRLLDEAGVPLAEEATSAAPPLAVEQLREATPEQLRAAAEQGARRLAAQPLAPGARVAFEAVLLALPEQARRFELAAVPLGGLPGVEQGG